MDFSILEGDPSTVVCRLGVLGASSVNVLPLWLFAFRLAAAANSTPQLAYIELSVRMLPVEKLAPLPQPRSSLCFALGGAVDIDRLLSLSAASLSDLCTRKYSEHAHKLVYEYTCAGNAF